MRECFTCHKRVANDSTLCPYCGNFVKLTKGQICILLGLICLFCSIKWLVLLLFAIIFSIIGCKDIAKYLALRTEIVKRNKGKEKQEAIEKERKRREEKQKNIKFRTENQEEFLSKLKEDYFEETGKKADFDSLKCSIFARDDDLDYNSDYDNEHQGEREYFKFDGKWCYFDFDYERMEYKFIKLEDKQFLNDCYIDKMGKKTKKLIKFIQANPYKLTFREVHLKDPSKILQTGKLIECLNCDYAYHMDNKKCPNCGMSTKENIEYS